MEKLTELLGPVGQHRERHVPVSRGKRAKRRSKQTKKEVNLQGSRDEDPVLSHSNNEVPEILGHVTVGFNSTTRYLESLAQRPASMGFENGADNPRNKKRTLDSMQGGQSTPTPLQAEPLAVIFIPLSDQASMLFAHLPVLVRLGNVGIPEVMTTRVVMLPKAAEAQLSTALKIPRVGIIGLMNAPMASELIEMVRAKVPPLQLSQLEKVAAGVYLPVKIVQTVQVGQNEQKRPKQS